MVGNSSYGNRNVFEHTKRTVKIDLKRETERERGGGVNLWMKLDQTNLINSVNERPFL
jgi:hypothetical protein